MNKKNGKNADEASKQRQFIFCKFIR